MANAGQQTRIPGQMGPMGAATALLPMLPKWARDRAKDFFAYVVEFLPITAGAALTVQTAIENDSDFLITSIVRQVTSVAAPPVVNPLPVYTVQVRDAGTGRNLFSDPIALDNIAGTAQLPSFLPYPKFIKRGSTLTTSLQSLFNASENVRIAYQGFKIFDWPEA